MTNNGSGWVNIPGATNATYTTPPLASTYNGLNYQVVLTNVAGSQTSTPPATLTVTAASPTVFSATKTASATSIVVNFSGAVDPATSLNAANYTLNNGASVSSVSPGSVPSSVVLTTSALAPGGAYNVGVKNVQDLFGDVMTASTNVVLPAGLVLSVRGGFGRAVRRQRQQRGSMAGPDHQRQQCLPILRVEADRQRHLTSQPDDPTDNRHSQRATWRLTFNTASARHLLTGWPPHPVVAIDDEFHDVFRRPVYVTIAANRHFDQQVDVGQFTGVVRAGCGKRATAVEPESWKRVGGKRRHGGSAARPCLRSPRLCGHRALQAIFTNAWTGGIPGTNQLVFTPPATPPPSILMALYSQRQPQLGHPRLAGRRGTGLYWHARGSFVPGHHERPDCGNPAL